MPRAGSAAGTSSKAKPKPGAKAKHGLKRSQATSFEDDEAGRTKKRHVQVGSCTCTLCGSSSEDLGFLMTVCASRSKGYVVGGGHVLCISEETLFFRSLPRKF